MTTRARTNFTDTKLWVRRHGSHTSKATAHREEKTIETASRRQGRRECGERD